MPSIKDCVNFIPLASSDQAPYGIGPKYNLGPKACVEASLHKAHTLGCEQVYIDSLCGKRFNKDTGTWKFVFDIDDTPVEWVTACVNRLPALLQNFKRRIAYVGNPWADLVKFSWTTGMRKLNHTLRFYEACGFTALAVDAFSSAGEEDGGHLFLDLVEDFGFEFICEASPTLRQKPWLWDVAAIQTDWFHRRESEGKIVGHKTLKECGPESILLYTGKPSDYPLQAMSGDRHQVLQQVLDYADGQFKIAFDFMTADFSRVRFDDE